jgi:hypothetical protein
LEVTLGAGVVAVPGILVVTVPVPSVAVSVSRTGFCVSLGVTGTTVFVLVSIITTGVSLGAEVGLGSASREDWTRAAAVAFRSTSGAGAVGCKNAGMQALKIKVIPRAGRRIFFIARLLF